jgi:hypothetical protein
LAVKENKGPFFRVRHDYERGHDTQHLSKHLREQLHSKLTSVTHENSVRVVKTKRTKTENSCDRSAMLETQTREFS